MKICRPLDKIAPNYLEVAQGKEKKKVAQGKKKKVSHEKKWDKDIKKVTLPVLESAYTKS